MADTNTETVPYNYSDIYTNVANSFTDRGYDTTESSDVSQLLTAMSYMISMLNANTSVNINEAVLSEAKERDNVFINARQFGYEAQHITSYRYTIELTLGIGSHVIPKYATFTIGSYTYVYFGAQLEYTNLESSVKVSLSVVEGTLSSYTDTDSLTVTTVDITLTDGTSVPQYYVDIPFTDVEDDGIECYCTYYDDYGRYIQRESWANSDYYVIDDTTTLDQEFVRIDDIEYGTPRIYFKFAGTGKDFQTGTKIEMNVLVSHGTDGVIEDVTDYDAVSFSFDSLATCSCITLESVGQAEETIDSVKENAPLFYNSANRCITASDYKSFCERQTTIYKAQVWGGDDEYPQVPGHIWFTFSPNNYTREFSYDEENDATYYTYTLDNSDGVTWDYTLDSESTDEDEADAYSKQYSDQYTFYGLRYIQYEELRSSSVNDDGDTIDPGVWDIVDEYKVPTLDFHNRNPLYVYFDYYISILKYSISDSKESIHSTIFDNIDNAFTGTDDDMKFEDFSTDYYNSTLDNRIYEILGDKKGYDLELTSKILLNEKTISTETSVSELKDLYIPLCTPYENYFDSDGYLQTDMLPSIDTEEFVSYTNNNEMGDIYTDWSSINEDIANGITQSDDSLICAKVMVDVTNTITLDQDDVDEDYNEGQLSLEFANILIQPDDITVLDDVSVEVTYLNTSVKLNGVEIPNDKGTGWFVDYLDGSVLYIRNVDIVAGDVVTISNPQQCGYYYLHNDYKTYIQIHLFVSGYNYTEGVTSSETSYTSPMSYFYSSDGKYIDTTDTYYITSEGYVSSDVDTIDDATIVSTISMYNYKYTPLAMNLFRQSRFLDLKYQNDSFQVSGNVMPRLRSVNFEKRV